LELQKDWDSAGLSERVSEVNVFDIRDIRAQLAGDSSQIEVRLGSQDQGKRLKEALDVLDEQRQTPRGALISYIDMSPGKRAIVGLASGVHSTTKEPSATTEEPESERKTTPAPVPRVAGNRDARTVDAKSKKATRDKRSGPDKKSDKTKDAARRRT
jgi:hypothetical protein